MTSGPDWAIVGEEGRGLGAAGHAQHQGEGGQHGSENDQQALSTQ